MIMIHRREGPSYLVVDPYLRGSQFHIEELRRHQDSNQVRTSRRNTFHRSILTNVLHQSPPCHNKTDYPPRTHTKFLVLSPFKQSHLERLVNTGCSESCSHRHESRGTCGHF